MSDYLTESRISFRVRWDYHRREPRDLRDAVRMTRRAYGDEVPVSLHEGNNNIGMDGTPRMNSGAEGYIFGDRMGSAQADEIVSYYYSPFRANLERMSRGDEAERRRAAIVSHVTIGSQGPLVAAVTEGVPSWCAKLVAFDALSAFLRSLTDLKVRRQGADSGVA
jgi:hypothetical protein